MLIIRQILLCSLLLQTCYLTAYAASADAAAETDAWSLRTVASPEELAVYDAVKAWPEEVTPYLKGTEAGDSKDFQEGWSIISRKSSKEARIAFLLIANTNGPMAAACCALAFFYKKNRLPDAIPHNPERAMFWYQQALLDTSEAGAPDRIQAKLTLNSMLPDLTKK